HRRLGRAHRVCRQQGDAEATPPRRGGRPHAPGPPRLPDRARRDVRLRRDGRGVLRADVRLTRRALTRRPDALRLARARRGGGARALHGLPPGPASDFTLAVPRCFRGWRNPHGDTAHSRRRWAVTVTHAAGLALAHLAGGAAAGGGARSSLVVDRC